MESLNLFQISSFGKKDFYYMQQYVTLPTEQLLLHIERVKIRKVITVGGVLESAQRERNKEAKIGNSLSSDFVKPLICLCWLTTSKSC